MKKNFARFKKSFIFITILLLSLFLLNIFVSKKINSILEDKLGEKGFEFEGKFSTNILFGNIDLTEVKITKDSLFLKSNSIEVKGISYFKFLMNDVVTVNSIIIKNPLLSGKITKDIFKNKIEKDATSKKQKDFKIGDFKILNGSLNIVDEDLKNTKIKKLNIDFKDVVVDNKIKTAFPFSYNDVNIEVLDYHKKMSEIQELNVDNISISKNQFTFNNLEINPLKSEAEYDNYITEKKGLMSLKIQKIESPNFKMIALDSLSIYLEKLNVVDVNFEYFLDKTRYPTSNKYKKLYSKALRELPFHLKVDQIDIINSKLIYKELTDKEKEQGVLVFDDLNVSIKGIDNDKKNKTDTEVNIQTNFMGTSPLDIKYNFAINNLQDKFRIRGTLKNVTSKNMSSYISPALHVKMEGFINRMDFDFEGNESISNGEFNIDFKNFKVKILNEKRELDKILSFLANIFVKDSAKDGVVIVDVENIERNKTKSFWNFFWLNIKKGLQESLL
ncbi:DUF748 domain-containing protein [Polaribacter sp. Asnod1-A03]|uniref:DUF748 domain-containing protein n=1 Tax=Polaribacter sp. Asnod1-A03 TaxID=3160581 RepID=UPI00386EE62A